MTDNFDLLNKEKGFQRKEKETKAHSVQIRTGQLLALTNFLPTSANTGTFLRKVQDPDHKSLQGPHWVASHVNVDTTNFCRFIIPQESGFDQTCLDLTGSVNNLKKHM